MTVMGIMTKPMEARATAPVPRFARLDSTGREDEWWVVPAGETKPVDVRIVDRETYCRSALRLEKYKADPIPVRKVEGRVPRQNCFKGCGPREISRMTVRKELDPDCWTRVLRRSAGCRRTADRIPEVRPAAKWNAKWVS